VHIPYDESPALVFVTPCELDHPGANVDPQVEPAVTGHQSQRQARTAAEVDDAWTPPGEHSCHRSVFILAQFVKVQ